MNKLGCAEYETGYRHGKRDWCCGLRSPALLSRNDEYSEGYRKGLVESETEQREWLDYELSTGL